MRTDRWAKSMGRISRFGSFAVASSMKENQQQQPSITCTTFNILAPIYKRINDEVLIFFNILNDTNNVNQSPFQKGNLNFHSFCRSMEAGSELPRERLQSVLVGQESQDIGLVVE